MVVRSLCLVTGPGVGEGVNRDKWAAWDCCGGGAGAAATAYKFHWRNVFLLKVNSHLKVYRSCLSTLMTSCVSIVNKFLISMYLLRLLICICNLSLIFKQRRLVCYERQRSLWTIEQN